MDAIKVTRQNLSYVLNYVVKDAPWAADLEGIMERRLADCGEWTYVYSSVRSNSEGTRTIWNSMAETRFNRLFEFTNGQSPFLTMPITRK